MFQGIETSEDEDTATMIGTQAPLLQLNNFNSRFSVAWSERAGNATLSQLNIQAAGLDPDRYSCFQLSPVAPPFTFDPFPILDDDRARRPLVVERAMAPRTAPRLMQSALLSRKVERGGSPMIMERYLAEHQDARETRSIRRRQERSPPQKFSPTLSELVHRAHATRELIGERFLQSLDSRSCYSPELQLAIKLANDPSHGSSLRSPPPENSRPMPLTRGNIAVIESRHSRERSTRSTTTSSRQRSSQKAGDDPRRYDGAAREPVKESSRHRSSSVPVGPQQPAYERRDPSLISIQDVSRTELRRVETYPERASRATSTHSARRKLQFTEVRSLKEVDRPSSIGDPIFLEALQPDTADPEKLAKAISIQAEIVDDLPVDKPQDRCQSSGGDQPVSQRTSTSVTSILADVFFQPLPIESQEEIIAIQDLSQERKSLLTMLPQPLKVVKTPESSADYPTFKLDDYTEHRNLRRESSSSKRSQSCPSNKISQNDGGVIDRWIIDQEQGLGLSET